MQQRYCDCGRSLWVQYVFNGNVCRTRFWNQCHAEARRLVRCPECGGRLHIDRLN